MSTANQTGLTVYKASNESGNWISGTAAILSARIGLSVSYVQQLARTGETSRNGWTVERIAEGDRAGRHKAQIYAAEREGDDPIVGPAEEIAALTGFTTSNVRRAARKGIRTRNGWRFRPATPEEIADADGV
jgi:hypothetical protein